MGSDTSAPSSPYLGGRPTRLSNLYVNVLAATAKTNFEPLPTFLEIIKMAAFIRKTTTFVISYSIQIY